MRRFVRAMATIVALACLAAGDLEAAVARIAFTGTVTDRSDYGAPALGSHVSGAYTIDLDSPGTTISGCYGFVDCLAYTAISFEWNGFLQTPYNATSIGVKLYNSAPGAVVGDRYEFAFSTTSMTSISLSLRDPTGSAFEAASDPLVPSLAAFSSATFHYSPFCITSISCIGTAWYGGTIDTLTVTFGPTLASIDPGAMYPNSTGTVTLTGAHFVSGATSVAVSGSGVTATNVQVVDSSQLTATFTVAASAAAGARNVTATTSGGKSNAITFTVGTLPPCSIAMNKTSFVNGDQVIAQVLQFGNPTAVGLAVEYKLWLTVPGTAPGVIARGGADGSFVLPANSSKNLGPAPLFTVASGFPRGTYSLNCKFLNPATGAEFEVGTAQFTLQ